MGTLATPRTAPSIYYQFHSGVAPDLGKYSLWRCMMPPKNTALRAVDSEDFPHAPASREPMTISEASEAGDRLGILLCLQDTIAREIEAGIPPRDLAALSRRLMEIAKEVEDLRAVEADSEDAHHGQHGDEAFDATAI